MPANYTGDPTATQAPSAPPGPNVAPTVQLPLDPDPFNAASHYQVYKVLADFLAWALLHGAFDDQANTFTGTNSFSSSLELNGTPAITTASASTQAAGVWRAIGRFPVRDGGNNPQQICFIYVGGNAAVGWEIGLAVNCVWDTGGAQWVRVATGNPSFMFRVGMSSWAEGGMRLDVHSHASADTWIDTAWSRLDQFKVAWVAGTITAKLGAAGNAITLDDAGLSGPGTTQVTCTGYSPINLNNLDPNVAGHGSFRKQLPVAPAVITFLNAPTNVNITNGGLAAGYVVLASTTEGLLVDAQTAVPGGLAAYYAARFSVT